MHHISFSPKRSSLVAFLALTLAMFACVPNEPTPDRPSGDWQVLAITDEANSRYIEYAVSQASAVTSGGVKKLTARVNNANLFLGKDSIRGIGGRVSKVYSFRDNLYVFLPEQKRIEIISSTTFRPVKTLDFTAQNRIPTDIIFANATTGYIAFENATVLAVIDISSIGSFVIAREIEVGRNPVALQVQGNQIYCALRGENQVIILDSRDTVVKARIPVPTAPVFIGLTVSGQDLFVVSAGGGRYDNLPRTAPRASRISLSTQRITQQAPIVNTADSTTEAVYGLVVTDQDYAYIPMSRALYQVDVQNVLLSQSTLEGVYRNVGYNPIRNEVLVAEIDSVGMSASCIIINPRTGKDSLVVPLTDLRARPKLLLTK